MNIVVVGCGKVGSALAEDLLKNGHQVSVVAEKLEDLENLKNFNSQTVVGVPIDEDVLNRAGIENCDCVIVLTRADNINLMVSQMAKHIYKVERVIIRVFEESRKEYYEQLGIKTICTTKLAVDGIMDQL